MARSRLCSHPIDVVKTRLQVSGSGGSRNYKALGIGGTVGVIAKEEGVLAFWKGIGPAWMREASYTSLRLGLYGPLKTAFGVHKESHFLLKFAVGSLAGAIGSIAGNPFDVLKTRMMTAEGKAPPSMRGAASDLYAHRGLAGFYRGLEVRGLYNLTILFVASQRPRSQRRPTSFSVAHQYPIYLPISPLPSACAPVPPAAG